MWYPLFSFAHLREENTHQSRKIGPVDYGGQFLGHLFSLIPIWVSSVVLNNTAQSPGILLNDVATNTKQLKSQIAYMQS